MGCAARIIEPTGAEILAFNRRPFRGSRGRVAGRITAATPPPPTPDSILGGDLLSWRRSDDATQSAGTLTGWADRVGAATLTLIAGAPAVTAADATISSRPSITFDGVDDAIAWLMDRPAPDATPTTIIAVLKQVSFTASDAIWGAGNNILALNQTSSPNVAMRNNTLGPNNNGAAVGSWKAVFAQYTGSTSDSLRIGSVSVTGTNTGIQNPGATFTLGARTGPALFSNIAVVEIMAAQRTLSEGDFDQLETYLEGLYGAGIFT